MSCRRFRSSIVFFAVAIASANPIRAEDPYTAPPDAPYTREQLDSPLKRQLTFERSDKPYAMKLFRADPKLLEQQVIAIVSLAARPVKESPGQTPRSSLSFWRGSSSSDSSEQTINSVLSRRQAPPLKILESHHFDPFHSKTSWSEPPPRSNVLTNSTVLRTILSHQPAEQLPPQDVTAFFLSDDVDHGFLFSVPKVDQFSNVTLLSDSDAFFEFRIVAPSNERAEALAAGLLRILDVGMSRPMRVSLWDERKAQVDLWKKHHLEAVKSYMEIVGSKAEMDASKDINSEGLNEVRNQRMLLTVDITGAKARLEACDKLLASDQSVSRLEQLRDLKVVVDVELVGMNAKLAAVDSLVTQIRKRISVESEHKSKTERWQYWAGKMAERIREIREIDIAFERFGPLQLSKDRVLLQPIDWRDTGK